MDENVSDDTDRIIAEQHNDDLALENSLMTLLDPSTTPEEALQLFSTPILSSVTYATDTDDIRPVVVFLAYLRFIITRRPLDLLKHLDSIWEDILRKTLEYSRNFSERNQHTLTIVLHGFEVGVDNIFELDDYNRMVPSLYPPVSKWIKTALEIPSMCPNPYIRLELFRLNRLFDANHHIRDRDAMCLTFFDTICEIKPHSLYPSGNAYNVMFSAIDLDHVLTEHKDQLQHTISEDLDQQLSEKSKVIGESEETKFVSHCIQLIGVFAVMAESKPDDNIKISELGHCWVAFKKGLGRMVNCDHLHGMPLHMQFRHVFASHPLFHHYIIDTVRDLTMAITNCKPGNAKQMLMILRDIIVEEQDLSNQACKLPSLLLSRQVEGPRRVHQHSLLLKGLGKKEFDGVAGADLWAHIERKLHCYNVSRILNNYIPSSYFGEYTCL